MNVIRSMPARPTAPDVPKQPAPGRFEPLFARAHKRALGVAVGLTVGGAVFAITVIHVVLKIEEGLLIGLLGQYFFGYTVTWWGALIGLAWGFATGFIAGWLLGFVHNFTVSVRMLF